MSCGKLNTVLLTTSIADGTGVDRNAGSSISVQSSAWVAYTVVGASGVHTAMLTPPIMDLTFINIWVSVSYIVAIISIEAGVAVPAVVPVSVQSINSQTWGALVQHTY